MDEDLDPISRIGVDHGCCSCGTKTDRFYFVEYYILPSRLVRKRHRDRNRFEVYCCSCYEERDKLDIEINSVPTTVDKNSKVDPDSTRCFVCGSHVDHTKLHGLLTVLLLMAGAAIESRPLAFLCDKCVEEHVIEL